MRRENEVLCDGDFYPVHMGKSIFAFERVMNGKRLLSVCNMCGREAKLPKHLRDWDKLVISNYSSVAHDVMQPFEFRLMEESCDG